MAKANKETAKLSSTYPYVLIVSGILGLFSAIRLTFDKFNLLENPDATLSCDINPIVACGSVINTDQASAFGFPNPILGVAGFAVVVTIGVSVLAGAKYKKWFWLGLQYGAIFGVLFVHWLIYQSLYTIGALCPYCMVVWVSTIAIFWYTTLYNLQEKNLKTPKSLKKAVAFATKYRAEILLLWYIIILLLILNKFWYYWSTLI